MNATWRAAALVSNPFGDRARRLGKRATTFDARYARWISSTSDSMRPSEIAGPISTFDRGGQCRRASGGDDSRRVTRAGRLPAQRTCWMLHVDEPARAGGLLRWELSTLRASPLATRLQRDGLRYRRHGRRRDRLPAGDGSQRRSHHEASEDYVALPATEFRRYAFLQSSSGRQPRGWLRSCSRCSRSGGRGSVHGIGDAAAKIGHGRRRTPRCAKSRVRSPNTACDGAALTQFPQKSRARR